MWRHSSFSSDNCLQSSVLLFLIHHLSLSSLWNFYFFLANFPEPVNSLISVSTSSHLIQLLGVSSEVLKSGVYLSPAGLFLFPCVSNFPTYDSLWLLRSTRRSNQSILKETSPGCSLEGLMLKLKLQYFGYLIWRTDSFEKALMLGKIEGERRRGRQRMRRLDGITNSMNMSLSKLHSKGIWFL